MSQVTFFILGLVIGFLIGFLAGRKFRSLPNWERTLLAIVITVLWAVSVGVSIFNQEYETPTALHGMLGIVAGYFFQGSIVEAVKSWKSKQ